MFKSMKNKLDVFFFIIEEQNISSITKQMCHRKNYLARILQFRIMSAPLNILTKDAFVQA